MMPDEFSVAFKEIPLMSAGYLQSRGIENELSVILSGTCLAYTMSRGTFVKVLKNYIGISIERMVSMSSWEDDIDDLTGWHDPKFEGFRIAIYDFDKSDRTKYVNKYGDVTHADIAYLTKGNLSKVLPYLRAVEEFSEFVCLVEERLCD